VHLTLILSHRAARHRVALAALPTTVSIDGRCHQNSGSSVTSHHTFRARSRLPRACSVSQRSASIIFDQFRRPRVPRQRQRTHPIGQMTQWVALRSSSKLDTRTSDTLVNYTTELVISRPRAHHGRTAGVSIFNPLARHAMYSSSSTYSIAPSGYGSARIPIRQFRKRRCSEPIFCHSKR
jgi:hypothetical protein